MMRRTLISLTLAAAVAVTPGCNSAESHVEEAPEPETPSFRIVAETGSDAAFTYAVDVQDSTAVFGRGADVVVVDVSDPSRPAVLGAVTLPGDVRDVVLRGSHVYAAADSAGFQIIDVADRRTPRIAGHLRFGDRVYGVDADGHTAYVAARSDGLHIVDVLAPEAPVEVGHVETPDEVVDVVVRDGYAYIAAWYESLRVIDVRNPATPKEASFASYDSYDNGAAWSVHVDGPIGVATVPDMGLRTVDISDPRDVKLYKVYRGLFAPAGAAVRGRTAFVADQDAGFRVLDLADPVQPVEIGSLQLSGRAMAVTLAGDVAYVAAREAGLRIVDITRPYDPREIASVDASDEIVDVAVVGDTLLAVGRQNGVRLHRASHARDTAGFIPATAHRVAADGNRLFMSGDDGIILFDRSDLSHPRATLRLPGAAHGLAIADDLVAVAAEQFGLRIVELDASGTLREVGSFEPNRAVGSSAYQHQILRTPPAAWDVVLGDNHAYAAFDDGLRVIDLSDPSRPVSVALHATPERVYRLVLRGSRLFAACDDGLRVIDVADPARPIERGYVKTPSFATALVLDDNRAYVGDLSGVLTVVDVAEDAHRTGAVEAAERILGLAITDEGIAVAAGRQGLRVIADIRDEEVVGSTPTTSTLLNWPKR